MRAIAVLLVLGCQGKPHVSVPLDGPPDGLQCYGVRTTACNVLTQTGCTRGQKCTWVRDNEAMPPLGHIGCVPIGSVAIGSGCAYLTTGICIGYDDCVMGAICIDGTCRAICDQNGGAPSCGSGFACAVTSGVFGPVGQPAAAGECFPICDPLADNDFLGSGSKPGSACGSGYGCYGEPDSTLPTHFSCKQELNPTLVHRSTCAGVCADAMGNPFLNGCAQGYVPLLYDMTGSMQVDCIAYCAPASCYAGNCGSNSANLTGDPTSTHQCNNTDARGSFNLATAGSSGNNGDQCMYSWLFEVGSHGLVRSPTSDTVGFCVDHSKYFYDPNGGTNYTTPWPKCDTLANPGFGSNAANPGAADFGCVSTSVAGL